MEEGSLVGNTSVAGNESETAGDASSWAHSANSTFDSPGTATAAGDSAESTSDGPSTTTGEASATDPATSTDESTSNAYSTSTRPSAASDSTTSPVPPLTQSPAPVEVDASSAGQGLDAGSTAPSATDPPMPVSAQSTDTTSEGQLTSSAEETGNPSYPTPPQTTGSLPTESGSQATREWQSNEQTTKQQNTGSTTGATQTTNPSMDRSAATGTGTAVPVNLDAGRPEASEPSSLDAGIAVDDAGDAAASSYAATSTTTQQSGGNSADAGTAVCEETSVRSLSHPCGLNGRGTVLEICNMGLWFAASCSDPDVCADTATQVLPCGDDSIQTQVCVAGSWQDTSSCGAASICANGSLKTGTTPCGLNLRGGLVQTCVNEAWLDTGFCDDADVCTDEAARRGNSACGLNQRGNLSEYCVTGRWIESADCEDPDSCTDGESTIVTASCGPNGRGSEHRVCVEGSWQSSLCQDADVCLDGIVQANLGCGRNARGTLVQTCSDGQWNFGTCLDNDVCVDSSSRLGAAICGLNQRGSFEEVCVVGQWSSTSVCEDPDTCVDDTTRPGTTFCEAERTGTLQQTCFMGGWLDTETCELSAPCKDDSSRVGTTPCGANDRGTLEQTCLFGAWRDTDFCSDTDICIDGTSDLSNEPCGANGRGFLLDECVLGEWVTSQTCLDVDICVDGTTQLGTTPCGDARGTFQRLCVDGQWTDSENCMEPAVCFDAGAQAGNTPCGLNARGVLAQRCESGNWVDDDDCIDPDECIDDMTGPGTTACDAGSGSLERICRLGQWLDSSNCLVPAEPRPNILLVVSDDVGAEASSVYPSVAGATTPVPTPTLEALAAQGLTFDNAWASPMCSPTRSTILTGKYGNRTGVTNAGRELTLEHETLYERIARELPGQYAMGVFGKWHLAGTNSNENQANEVLHVLASGVPTFRGFMGAAVEDFFRWEAVDETGVISQVEEYSTTQITNWALDYIQQHEEQSADTPWFVYVPYNAAHDPYQVPPSHLHNVDLGTLSEGESVTSIPVYKAMLQALDTEFGRLVGAVDLSETIVIYMGDNGTPREVKDTGSNIRGSKQGVYEGGVRVPLVISGAGVSRVGEREDDLVVSTDLFATILSLTGLDVPQVHDSYALNPLLAKSSASTGRTHAFTELCNVAGSHYAIRDTRYKLLYEERRWQLYDLATDPLETRNLYADSTLATVRSELETALRGIQRGSTAGCFR
jgi:arylsulfatase B